MESHELQEKIETEKLLYARFIFEVQGKPKEYVKEALDKMIETIKEEDGIEVVDTKFEDVIEIEEGSGIFSYLADAGILTKDFETMISLSLRYGPSVVHFMEPEKISLDMRQMQNILADVGRVVQGISQENVKLRLQLEKLRQHSSL